MSVKFIYYLLEYPYGQYYGYMLQRTRANERCISILTKQNDIELKGGICILPANINK